MSFLFLREIWRNVRDVYAQQRLEFGDVIENPFLFILRWKIFLKGAKVDVKLSGRLMSPLFCFFSLYRQIEFLPGSIFDQSPRPVTESIPVALEFLLSFFIKLVQVPTPMLTTLGNHVSSAMAILLVSCLKVLGLASKALSKSFIHSSLFLKLTRGQVPRIS